MQKTIRTFVEIPSKGTRESERSPRTTTIKTAVEDAIGSIAQSEPCVRSDVPQGKFVTKVEFDSFATNLFTKMDELKGSISAPVQTPPTNPIVNALKENTEAQI